MRAGGHGSTPLPPRDAGSSTLTRSDGRLWRWRWRGFFARSEARCDVGLWSRLARTFRRRRHDAEIAEELQFHLDMDVADGHTAREARIRLGGVTRTHEQTRDAGIIESLDSALRDLRLGWRQLRRTPGLSAAIVLSLTIGIGANTAIFSLVDAAILRPLPVSDPDSLRLVGWTNAGFPPGADNVNGE